MNTKLSKTAETFLLPKIQKDTLSGHTLLFYFFCL